MRFYGHSGKDAARDDWQALVDHLTTVGQMAAAFAQTSGLSRAAFVAGLFHDLGKYDPAFQAYISGNGASVDHSTAGAQILVQLARGNDRAMAEIIAYAILGHHAGLPDRSNETEACYEARMKRALTIDSAWRNELGPDLPARIDGLATELPRSSGADLQRHAFTLSFVGRMIFSCLVDADFKDTENFYASLGGPRAERDWVKLDALLDAFRARFDAHIDRFRDAPARSDTARPINALRTEILAHVRAGSSKKPGFFTLTVPTGGGKTLASLGFALDHARIHGHGRIIYAIPFAEAWIETHLHRLRTRSG